MSPKARGRNPFYFLLLLSGVAFTVTACAYGVMTVRGLNPATALVDESPSGLMPFLDRYGAALMLVEIAGLALSSVLAIMTDGFWVRRSLAAQGNSRDHLESEPRES